VGLAAPEEEEKEHIPSEHEEAVAMAKEGVLGRRRYRKFVQRGCRRRGGSMDVDFEGAFSHSNYSRGGILII
jgi:hypothetical protein